MLARSALLLVFMALIALVLIDEGKKNCVDLIVMNDFKNSCSI